MKEKKLYKNIPLWLVASVMLLIYITDPIITIVYNFFGSDLNFIILAITIEELIKFIPVICFWVISKKRTDLILFPIISGLAFAVVEIWGNFSIDTFHPTLLVSIFWVTLRIIKIVSLHILFTLLPSLALFFTEKYSNFLRIVLVTLCLAIAICLHVVYDVYFTNIAGIFI